MSAPPTRRRRGRDVRDSHGDILELGDQVVFMVGGRRRVGEIAAFATDGRVWVRSTSASGVTSSTECNPLGVTRTHQGRLFPAGGVE